MSQDTPLVRVEGLTKRFRVPVHRHGTAGALVNLARRRYLTVEALAGVSFALRTGELVGYLGPNGAGKSTTVKVLSGVLVPTAGDVVVAGRVPWRERAAHAKGIGVVFGQRTALWWDLPVIESLELLRHVYEVPADRHRTNLALFEGLLGLGEFLRTPVRSLSLGQRMRADLAAALLHDPAIVFLDEPTIGLDVVARERIRAFVAEVAEQRGVTVVLTTHDLGDVERLCRRVVLIDRGRILFDGPLPGLQARFGGDRELVVDLAADYAEVEVPGARVAERDGRRATYAFAAGVLSASELIARVAGRYRVLDLTVREPALETTLRRIYEEGLLAPEGYESGGASSSGVTSAPK